MAAADSSSSAYFSASYSPDPDLLNICSLTRHFDTWRREMDSDPDKAFILSGIAHGFHLVNDLSIVSPADCHNYRSAENPAVKPALDKLFQDELCFQRIEEVFNKPLRVNAIGSVTKKDTGEPRPITDMSRPLNNIAHFKDSAGLLMVLTNSLQTIFFGLVSKMRQVFFTGFPVRSRV